MLGRSLVLVAVLALSLCGCSIGGGSEEAARPAGQALDDWVRSWRGEVESGPRPNQFEIPVAPTLELPSAADELGRTVDDSASTFADELIELSSSEVKDVFCYWYAWYLNTGTTVPSPEEFPDLLLKYGFGRLFTSPPSQRLSGAIESFRNAIERGQSETEDVAYASVAAACA